MRTTLVTASLVALLAAAPASGRTHAEPQVPVPFPRPTQPPPATPPPATPVDPGPPVAAPGQPARVPTEAVPPEDVPPEDVPTEEMLGAPIYPGARFITSYDAGRGQRYYLFGTNADFAQIVAYYRNVMRTRGNEVFREPPVHMFDIARFRDQTMAFPPSVTVKDYSWGGSQGYLNPNTGEDPARYRTIIQIVPLPPGVSER